MGSVRITRLGGKYTPTSQEHQDLRTLIEMCDDLYPGIDAWYKKKVLSGLKEKERTAYVIYRDEQPAAAAILRLGDDPKLCSFRVLPEAEQNGYGKPLMTLIAKGLRSVGSTTFHFTIPEHIWQERSEFFSSYGMECLGPSKNQYRLFDQELYGCGSSVTLWNRVMHTLPDLMKCVSVNGIKSHYDLVMSIQPPYARDLLRGKKRVEVRRRFSEKWKGSETLVYSTSPENSFIGSFRISNVVSGSPTTIWNEFSSEIGCPREEFDRYTNGSSEVYAIFVSDGNEFKMPMLRSRISHILNTDIKAPQSYSRFREDSELEEALSIHMLLQSTL